LNEEDVAKLELMTVTVQQQKGQWDSMLVSVQSSLTGELISCPVHMLLAPENRRGFAVSADFLCLSVSEMTPIDQDRFGRDSIEANSLWGWDNVVTFQFYLDPRSGKSQI